MIQVTQIAHGEDYSFSPHLGITLFGKASRDSEGELVLSVPDCLARRQIIRDERYNGQTALFYPACPETDIRTKRGPPQFILDKKAEHLTEGEMPLLAGRFSFPKDNLKTA